MTESRASSLRLTTDVVQTLHRAAMLVYPEETCGLLLGTWGRAGEIVVRQGVLLPNSAGGDDRERRYRIEPRLLLEWERIAQRSGWTTVGFFHSHPDHDPRPSGTDASLAWPGYAYVIVSVTRGGSVAASPLVTGMAAWTFDETSARFNELPVKVEIDENEIEYFI